MPADLLTSDNIHLSRPKMADIQLVSALPELSKPTADVAVARLVRYSLAENSRRAYLSDLAHFESWGGRVPATDQLIASYITSPPTQTWQVRRRYSGVSPACQRLTEPWACQTQHSQNS